MASDIGKGRFRSFWQVTHLFKRKGIWYARFRSAGKDIWRSTGKKTRTKALEEVSRILEEHRSTDTLSRLIDQMLECLSKLPDDLQREERRRILSILSTGNRQPLTLSETWDKWAALPGIRDRASFGEDQSRWSKLTGWMVNGNGPQFHVGDLTAALAQDYISHLASSEITRHTLNVHLFLFRKVIRETREYTGIIRNPFADITLPRKPESASSKRALTDKEISMILKMLAPQVIDLNDKGDPSLKKRSCEWYGVTMVGAYLGLRLADAVLLNRRDFSEDFSVLTLIPRKNARYGEKARVLVPVHDVLGEYLKAAKCDTEGNFFPDIRRRYLNRGSDVSKDFIRHLKNLGLQTTEAGNPSGRKRRRNILGFHSLRYSFATIQRAQGVDPHVVKQMAGHTEIEMTDRYTSVGITEKKKSIGLLPDFTEQPS